MPCHASPLLLQEKCKDKGKGKGKAGKRFRTPEELHQRAEELQRAAGVSAAAAAAEAAVALVGVVEVVVTAVVIRVAV